MATSHYRPILNCSPSPVVTLFQNTRRHSNPVVVEEVALPCLTVLRNLTGLRPPPVLPLKEGEEGSVSEVVGCVLACSCKGRQGWQVVDTVPVPVRGCGGPGDMSSTGQYIMGNFKNLD